MCSSLLWCLPFLFLVLWISDIHAQTRTFTFKQGAVMARTLALDENKQPILVEYNERGEEVKKVDIPGEYAMDVAKLKVITAFEYHQEKARLDKFEELHKNDLWKDAEVMALDKFKELAFVTADGKTSITVPTLPSYVKSVLVRGRSARINPDPNELVLLSFSVDLSEEKTVPEKGSLVINDKGQVIYTSTNNIAPRVGFFGDPNKKQEALGLRKPEDQIYGPVKYVKVYISPEVFPGSMTSSDYRGKYSMSFMLPYCPGGFEYTTDIWAELRYANFSPYGSPTIPYYLRRQDWTYCYDLPPFSGASLGAAMSYVNAMASLATMSVPLYNADFKVDVMFLSGRILLKNPDGSPVTIGNATEYEATAPDGKRILQEHYDFDGDGKPDRIVLGRMVDKPQEDGSTKKVFEAYPAAQANNITDENALQGVYLSSSERSSSGQEPDLVRLADTKKTFTPNGKLKSISKDDLKNTDIYVFRESTGQLVLERNGLKDEEVAGRVDNGLGKNDHYYYYRLMLRGPMDNAINVGAINRSKNWEEWAEEYRLAEPFRKRESDYLKSNEWVRLVVINRVTGYMGTQRIQLGDASKNAGSMLSVKLDDTWLQPPNLKIWAERKYTPEKGIVSTNKDDKEKRYLIGQEGAALTSDTLVEVFTEWLDEEGRPLPEGLGADDGEQYGLSGRLARTTGKNTLGAVGGDLANFAIPPGRNIQVLKVSDNLTSPENFYVHVVGTQQDEKPNFSGSNTAEGLAGRPDKFTPFLTPLYDENKNWQTWSAYQKLKQDWADEENPDEKDKPAKPLPFYVWGYRPEYQFSQYKLEVAELNRVTVDEDGAEEKTNIYDAKTPVIASSDKLIELLYSLIGSNNERLDAIDGPQDLVFALGEEEIKVEIGSDKQIRFENIEHLASLMPEDFLTLRLYSNQDAGNILWEYAFEHLVLDTQLAGYDVNAGRTLYISADDPVVPLQARLLGYADRSKAAKKPIVVNWSAPGATLETTSETDDDQGVFFNEVKLQPVTGASTQVVIKLVNAEDTKTKLPKFEVVAGVPDQISVAQAGDNISMGGFGEKTLTFTVRDKNNNLVADGTGVSFFPSGSLLTVSADSATTNGRATVKVKGGDYAEAAKITFHVGDKVEVVDLDVRPLKINLASPSSLNASQSGTVVVTVTDADGKPAAGVDVSLGSTYGYLQQKELVTDASGRVSTTVTAPGSSGTGEITAQVLRSGLEKKAFAATYENPGERDLEVAHASMIGDKTTSDLFNYERFDGNTVRVAYNTSSNIQVQGNAGDSVTVTLGDSHDPNLAPLAAYYFNHVDAGVIDEDTDRYPLRAIQVSAQPSTRLGTGNSMSFTADTSKAWGDGLRAIGLPQSTGFALEVFPKGESGGALVNLGQGAQVLTYNNMRFTYTIRTADGEFSVTSAAIFPARWYQVSTRYHAGKVELIVNEARYEATATGAIDYQWSGNASGNEDAGAPHDLVIAGEFNGGLDNLKWYNLNSSPLMKFADGTTQTTVTIDASKKATLVLNSTGKLHEHGGKLGIHRVAIHTNKVNQYASLVSLDAFKVMAGMQSEGTPLEEQTVALPLSFIFPQAHAGWFMDALSLLLPIQELTAVFEQLTYAVTDPDKFEGDTFVVNLIIAATYLPPGRVLQPFAKTLGILFKTLKRFNPKFLKYFGGMFSGIVSKAKKGNFDALMNMIPFFIILAEMYYDEEARKGLEFMFQTVDSGEDILSWVEYFALPAEGWDGDGVPEVGMLLNNTEQQLPLSWMMNQAYAAPKLKKISGKVIGAALAKAAKRIGKESAEELPDTLRIIKQTVKSADAATIRKYLFNPSLLVATTGVAVRQGAKGVSNFLKGKTNARYKPITFIATVAYLEWELACGKQLDIKSGEKKDATAEQKANADANLSSMECDSKGITGSKNRWEVYNLYERVLADSVTKEFDEEPITDEGEDYRDFSHGHGAMYHLNQIAYYQLLHRAGGKKIKAIEGNRWVWLYKDEDALDNYKTQVNRKDGNFKKNIYEAYNRRVDIILESDGGSEQWIELKSYSAFSDTGPGLTKLAATKGKPFEAWGLSKGHKGSEYVLPKQFSLDRTASNVKHARLPLDEQDQNKVISVSTDFKWRFQKFKVKSPRTSKMEVSPSFGSQKDKDTIYGGLAQPIQEYQGKFKDIYEANMGKKIEAKDHIEYADLKEFLQSLAVLGFEEALEAVKEEAL